MLFPSRNKAKSDIKFDILFPNKVSTCYKKYKKRVSIFQNNQYVHLSHFCFDERLYRSNSLPVNGPSRYMSKQKKKQEKRKNKRFSLDEKKLQAGEFLKVSKCLNDNKQNIRFKQNGVNIFNNNSSSIQKNICHKKHIYYFNKPRKMLKIEDKTKNNRQKLPSVQGMIKRIV